jgi:gamma-glutamylcyclotransferase
MKYFAYGSNMNPQRMRERKINYTSRIAASLQGYSLKFNKVASRNPLEEGYANIVPEAKGVVEGVLYEIQEADLKNLDKYEGYPDNYDRQKVKVLTVTGQEEAIAYIACPDKIREGLKPAREYLVHLLAAKDMLSEDYYRKLLCYDTLD